MPKVYNKINFHTYTFCVFQEVDYEIIKDRKLDFKSKSGSQYYFTPEGVFRYSDHWGRAANCKWRLESNNQNSTNRNRVGYANWTDFYQDNDTENIYFASVDFTNKTAAYAHKSNGVFPENAMLRTASETTKVIKQIRNLFKNDAWAKHYDNDDIEVLRNQIINKLITSNKSIQQIKSELFNAL